MHVYYTRKGKVHNVVKITWCKIFRWSTSHGGFWPPPTRSWICHWCTKRTHSKP